MVQRRAGDAQDSLREDARWIGLILAGPPGAREECFRLLLEKYWKLVVVLAANRVGDRREAEDIAQEAFFRAFRSLAGLGEPIAFLGWLLKIARNLATDHLRSRRTVISLDAMGAAGTLVGSGEPGGVSRSRRFQAPEFERDLESSEEADLALRALETLPEKYREVVALRYLQGLDGKAMAVLLGEPEGTVRNRLFRALEKLRTHLEHRRAQKS